MANFFKEPLVDMRNPPDRVFRGFPSCTTRTKSVSSRVGNITGVTNNMASMYSNDATIDPIAKEIVNRLEVVNKIVPPEDVQQISQEFINKLNNICYEKIAEQVRSAPSINGLNHIPSSAASQKSRRLPPSNGFITNNGDDVTSRVFDAAKQVQREKQLTTITEVASDGLMVPSSRDNVRKVNKPLKVTSSYNQNDFSQASQKPVSSGRLKALSQPADSEPKVKRRRGRVEDKEEYWMSSIDLNITKNSLRSNNRKVSGKKRNAVAAQRNPEKLGSEACSPLKTKYEAKQPKRTEDISSFFSDEDSNVDVSVQIEKLKNLPKKTALSPFFERFQKRRAINTSTPMKGMC